MTQRHTLWTRVSFATVVATLGIASCRLALAEDPARPRPIRIAIFAGDGVTANGLPKVRMCFPRTGEFSVRTVDGDDIRKGALKKFDVLIHPGGSGSGQAKSLGEEGRERVRKFVDGGGGFIGICAGAYLASAEYPWSLNLLDAHVVDDEHWARGVGEVKIRFPQSGRTALGTNEELMAIHYENGPLLGPGRKNDIPDFESLADFETEIAKNGAPTGVMKGTSAIARGKFGKGRVVCFSPHPERSPGGDSFVRAAARWAAEPSRNP